LKLKRKVKCGNIYIGGDAPVSIQSMLNVSTTNIPMAIKQISELHEAGCDVVRLAIPDFESAQAFGTIKKEVVKIYGEKAMPLVADIHFDYKLALAAIENGADKIRINPGNIGGQFEIKAVADAAKKKGIPIRVGINSGSLEKDILKKYGKVTAKGLVESALKNVKLLEDADFSDIVVSIKSSDVKMNYDAHKILDELTDYPLHIGITESGTNESGIIKSSVGIGALLLFGIGNTIRVSLTADPVKEVLCAKEILESIGLRSGGINIISCPTCGRTKVDLEKIVTELTEKLEPIKRQREKEGKSRISVAVMGCIVNGPGEAKEADIGVACGDGKGAIFVKGEVITTVSEDKIAKTIISLI
jgi:(E)-4-hydroxy-3-methylbut-2-enyl-diphosphate synthase